MTQLSVFEWLLRANVLVNLSEINSFLLMLENDWNGPPLPQAVFDKIREIENLAWISPDYSTKVETLETSSNNLNLRLMIEFRLRTLCFDFMVWRCPKKNDKCIKCFQRNEKCGNINKKNDWNMGCISYCM